MDVFKVISGEPTHTYSLAFCQMVQNYLVLTLTYTSRSYSIIESIPEAEKRGFSYEETDFVSARPILRDASRSLRDRALNFSLSSENGVGVTSLFHAGGVNGMIEDFDLRTIDEQLPLYVTITA